MVELTGKGTTVGAVDVEIRLRPDDDKRRRARQCGLDKPGVGHRYGAEQHDDDARAAMRDVPAFHRD